MLLLWKLFGWGALSFAQLIFPGPGGRNAGDVLSGVGLSGSRFTLRYQEQEGARGDFGPQRSELRVRMDLDVWVPITENLKLSIQSQNGSTYQGGWDTLADYSAENPENLNFVIRRAFLQYDGLGPDQKIQVGALDAGSRWVETLPNSFDTDGWRDGFLYAIRNLSQLVDQIHLTIGELNPAANPNLFQRGLLPNGFGFGQIKVLGEFSDRVDYQIEANRIRGPNGTESFIRNRLSYDILSSVIQQIRAEIMLDTERGRYTGDSFAVLKDLGRSRLELGLFKNDHSPLYNRIVNGFFNEPGRHVYMVLNIRMEDFFPNSQVAKDTNWIHRLRSCMDPNVCAGAYRYDSSLEYRLAR